MKREEFRLCPPRACACIPTPVPAALLFDPWTSFADVVLRMPLLGVAVAAVVEGVVVLGPFVPPCTATMDMRRPSSVARCSVVKGWG